jgi:hypothetical protein
MKEDRKDDRQARQQAAYQLCNRLGAYRMPFAFAITPLSAANEPLDLYVWQPEKLQVRINL